jgi:hypothetical protein
MGKQTPRQGPSFQAPPKAAPSKATPTKTTSPPAAVPAWAEPTGTAARDPSAPSHEEIEIRAYAIWLSEGSPEGRAQENWFEAERQLRAGPGARPRL